MYCIKNVTEDILWLGGNDRRLSLFENVYKVPRGVSYNSYLIRDDKNVLLDTVDKAISERFFENLEHALQGKQLDYVIINHVEPDHCATLAELAMRYPDTRIAASAKAITMIKQFFEFDGPEMEGRFMTIKEGDTLETGKHSLTFLTAPMVHWPEVTVTFDKSTGTLFSADAFGTFGALDGFLFADQLDFEHDWLPDARRYYTNIVGKYGTQVQALLKKASTVEIKTICPLHGPVWRENIGWFIEKYQKWSSYQPEENGVVIAFASVYGHTENAAEILAEELARLDIKTVLYDVSVTSPDYIISEAFRYSHIVFASTTYNNGIFCNMETLLSDLSAHNLQNRTVGIIENGSWAPVAGKLIRQKIEEMKNMTILENNVTLRSSVKEQQREQLSALARSIRDTIILIPV